MSHGQFKRRYVDSMEQASLPTDVLWGLFVTHSFLSVGEKWMRDEQTPQDVCGEATQACVKVSTRKKKNPEETTLTY